MRVQHPAHPISTRRGTGLAMVLLMSSVLAIMVAAVGLNTMTHLQGTNANLYRKQSRHAAYGGIQWALAHLSRDRSWVPEKNPYVLDFHGRREVTVEIQVFNNTSGSLGTPFVAPNGVVVPKGATYILTLGCAANQKSLSTSAMSTMAYTGAEMPASAVFADQRLEMEDSETDVWTSLVNNTRVRYSAAVSASGASIGTNATEKSIILKNSKIRSDLLLGSGGQRAEVLLTSDGSDILGETRSEAEMLQVMARKPPEWLEHKADDNLPAVERGGQIDPGSYDSIRLGKGETLRISSGEYYVRNTLSLTGARIVIDPPGPVTVYVGGHLSLTEGSKINPDDTGPDTLEVGQSTSGLPGNLKVHLVGNGNTSIRPTFEMKGGSKAWMSVSGRGLAGELTNAELYGSLKGESLVVKKSKIHYDQATRTTGIQVAAPPSSASGGDAATDSAAIPTALTDLTPEQMAEIKGSGMGSGTGITGPGTFPRTQGQSSWDQQEAVCVPANNAQGTVICDAPTAPNASNK